MLEAHRIACDVLIWGVVPDSFCFAFMEVVEITCGVCVELLDCFYYDLLWLFYSTVCLCPLSHWDENKDTVFFSEQSVLCGAGDVTQVVECLAVML